MFSAGRTEVDAEAVLGLYVVGETVLVGRGEPAHNTLEGVRTQG